MERIKGRGSEKKRKSSVSNFIPTDDDCDVAQILLDLRSRFSLIEFLADSDSNWNRKGRRSCLEPSIQTPAAAKGGDHRSTTSPDSPIVFVPSEESHQKFNQQTSRKKSKNYSVEIQQLMEQKGFLQREIENVKECYAKLKAYSSELRSIKNQAIRSTHQHPIGPITAHSQPPNNGLGPVNRVGPIGFDLNVPAEETFGSQVVDERQPLDVNRARYAEARKIRRRKMKNKSTKSRL